MADNLDETSIKQVIQNMTGGEVSVYQGTVISASPLQIQIANDEKLVITEANTYVPWQLTNYQTTVDIVPGSVTGSTASSGSHAHGYSGSTEREAAHTHTYSGETGGGGDPEHTHSYSGETGSAGAHSHSYDGSTESAGDHTHSISTVQITGATMTVYNALKAGDKVHILSFNHGKQYYVLDRVE